MPDILAEMKEFARGLDSEAAESEGATGAAPDTAEDQDDSSEAPHEVGEASQEDGEEPQEDSEEKSESKDEDEEEGDKSKKKDEKKKAEDEKSKSSYQRLQKRLDIAKEDAKQARKNAAEALVLANDWRARAQVLAQELRRVIAQAQKAGVNRDIRDDALLTTRIKESSQKVHSAAPEYMAKVDEDAEIAELQTQHTEQAADLSVKFKGVSQGEILRAYAVVVESSSGEEDVSMDEVAEMLYERKRRASGRPTQQQKNRSLPSPLKKNSISRPPEFKADRDGMKSYLKSQGLA